MLFALVDSTGLKVYGQGEWHVKMHKASKRRTWLKLSLVVDPISHEIIDNNLTSSNTHDSIVFLPMIPKLPDTINTLWGDGAYDSATIYKTLFDKGIKPIIPPQVNAILSQQNYRKQRYLGRKSLVQGNQAIIPREAAIEYINLFPDKEEGRKRNQQAEARVKCSILNKMIQIASANSYPLKLSA